MAQARAVGTEGLQPLAESATVRGMAWAALRILREQGLADEDILAVYCDPNPELDRDFEYQQKRLDGRVFAKAVDVKAAMRRMVETGESMEGVAV